MADTRGLYTIDAAGTATLVKNLEDTTNFSALAGSFQIAAPVGSPVMAQGQSRYEGATVIGETHDNATISWSMYVTGTTYDGVLATMESLFGTLETWTPNLFVGWKPDGATNLNYYEVRGPAEYNINYDRVPFVTVKSIQVDIKIPVAPLSRQAAPTVFTAHGAQAPRIIALGCQYNLITNPSFETDTDGWASQFAPAGLTGTNFARVAANPLSGTYSARVQATRPADTTLRSVTIYQAPIPDGFVPVVPGQQLSVSSSVNVISAWTNGVRVRINWYQADIGWISASVGTSQTGTGVKTCTVTGTAPPLAAFAMICALESDSTTASQVLDCYLDGISCVLGATPLSPYKDGASAGWAWAGPAHRSESYNATGTSVPGNAPALASVSVRHMTTANPPPWALIAWWKRMTGTPIAASKAPLGIFEAGLANSFTTFAATGADAAYRNNGGLTVTTSGAGSGGLVINIDPSLATPDDFSQTIEIEFWARVKLAAGVVSPRLSVYTAPVLASGVYGTARYTTEFGSAGRLLTVPTATAFRFTRLGVLTFPVNKLTPLAWGVFLGATWQAGSTGIFGLDYLCAVPARQRVVSPTGRALDTAFPRFIPSALLDATKTVRPDLSGLVGSGVLNQAGDSGLGGSRLWMPSGDVDMLVKLSSMVPDDPTLATTSETISHPTNSVSVSAIPRQWLVRN